MRSFNYYFVRSKANYAMSIRLNDRIWVLRLDKIGPRWKFKFLHYKLKNLDILGLYYEVGFLKYQTQEEKK